MYPEEKNADFFIYYNGAVFLQQGMHRICIRAAGWIRTYDLIVYNRIKTTWAAQKGTAGDPVSRSVCGSRFRPAMKGP